MAFRQVRHRGGFNTVSCGLLAISVLLLDISLPPQGWTKTYPAGASCTDSADGAITTEQHKPNNWTMVLVDTLVSVK
jgi:hypothetical protein